MKIKKIRTKARITNVKNKLMSCRVIYDKDIPTTVLTKDGKESALYKAMAAKTGNNKETVNDYLTVTSKEVEDVLLQEFLKDKKTTVKPGVSGLFESNPELASIGTQEQYSQYLNTIFPDSKVKDIVYHGGPSKIIDKFKNNLTEDGNFFKGIFFSNSLSYIKQLGKKFKKDTSKVTPAVINSLDNFQVNESLGYGVGQYWYFEQYDSIQGKDFGQEVEGDVFAVRKPEQIHILGSKQDIQGFKKFVSTKPITQPQETIDEIDRKYKTEIFDKNGELKGWVVDELIEKVQDIKEIKEKTKKYLTEEGNLKINFKKDFTKKEFNNFKKKLHDQGFTLKRIYKKDLKYPEVEFEILLNSTNDKINPLNFNIHEESLNKRNTPEYVDSFGLDLKKETDKKRKLHKEDIVNLIKTKGSTTANQLLLLLEDKLSPDLIVYFDSKLNKNQRGEYNSMSKEIKLQPNLENIEDVLMHELIHDATVHMFRLYEAGQLDIQQEIAVENLRDSYNSFIKAVREDRANGTDVSFNAEMSLEEFISDLFTDPNLQGYLNSKRSENNVSIWTKIIRNLLNILGIRSGSLAEEALVNAYTLLGRTPTNMFHFEGKYNKLSKKEMEFYTSQLEGMSKKQKKVFKRLIDLQSRYVLADDGSAYIDMLTEERIELDRTTNVIDKMTGPQNQKDYYTFDDKYEDDKYEANRQWGIQADIILEGLVLKKSKTTIKEELEQYQKENDMDYDEPRKTGKFEIGVPMDPKSEDGPDIVDVIYKEFENLLAETRKEFPGIKFMTQVTLGNTSKRFAGTMDLVGVKKNGEAEIFDLKTSVKTTDNKGYDVMPGVKNFYWKPFGRDRTGRPKKASKKQKHQAQLSLYKALMYSKGIPVGGTYIVPLKLGEDPAGQGDPYDSAALEDTITLNSDVRILKPNSFDEGWESEYAAGKSISDLESTVHIIKLVLQKKVDDFRAKNRNQKAKIITSILNKIEELEEAEAIEKFINEAYTSIVGTDNWAGYYKKTEEIIQQVRKGKINGLDALHQLNEQKIIFEMYKEAFEAVRKHFDFLELLDEKSKEMEKMKKKFAKGKTYKEKDMSTLEKVFVVKNHLENLPSLQNELDDITATVLYNVAKRTTKEVDETIKNIEESAQKKIDRWKGEMRKTGITEKRRDTLQKYIDNLKEKTEEKVSRLRVDKDTLLYQLKNGPDSDIGIINAYFTPGIQSDNTVIALYTRMLKDEFEAVRYRLIDTVRSAGLMLEERKEFIGDTTTALLENPEKLNEGIYTTVTFGSGKNERKHYSFISEINYEEYKRQEKLMWERSKEIHVEERQQFIQDWYTENTEFIPKEDTVLENPYDKSETVILHRGRKSMKKYLMETHDPNEMKKLLKEWKSTKDLPRGLRPFFLRPKASKYKNPAFEGLSGENKKYHDGLLFLTTRANERLPVLDNEWEKYFIPTVLRDSKERITTDPKSLLDYQKNKIKAMGGKGAQPGRTEDVEMYGREDTDIPVLYRYKDMPIEDVSVDILRSVVMFEEESLRYQSKLRLMELGETILGNFRDKPPAQTTPSGIPIIKKARTSLEKNLSKLGISEASFNDYLRKNEGSHVAAAMHGLIDMHIHGKHKMKEVYNIPVIGTFDAGKWADALISFASHTQVGATNPFLALSNSLMAETQVLIEAFANKHYSTKDWAYAQIYYDKAIPDMINDFTKPVNKSLIGQLIDLYDPIQGHYLDMYGRKITSTTASKLLSSNSWFFMMRQGEHHAQVTSLIAMLRHAKVMQNGEEISLLDAYELGEDGKIKLKKGINIGEDSEAEGLVNGLVKNRLHSINKGMHGNYNQFDKVLAERYAAGRLLTMYRKFVVTGFKRRFDKTRVDWEQGLVVEGTYRTFWEVLRRDYKQMMLALVPGTESHFVEELSELEKENLIRAAAEFAFIFSTGATIMALQALPPPDEDEKFHKWAKNAAIYSLMRLNVELSFFGAPFDPQSAGLPGFLDTFRMFRTPFISMSIIEKIINIAVQMSAPGETYKRDVGFAEKGDLKLIRKIYKLFGLSGTEYIFHPEEAIKVLELQTR